MRSIIDIQELSTSEIDELIEVAKDIIANPQKYSEKCKGKKLATEKYYLIYSDNTEERIGGTWWGLARFLNPFAKKTEKTTIYKFNKSKGYFE